MRPNIVLLTTDQQSWDATSFAGNPHVRTPNLDRLLQRCLVFERAYSTDPVCTPQRTTWTTGRYSSETGSPFNEGSLHPDIPDLGAILRESGYKTVHVGKWHVDGRDPGDGFEVLYSGGLPISAGGGQIHDAAIARAAVSFLGTQAGPDPFFLQVHFVNPHDVCEYLHARELAPVPNAVDAGLLSEDDLPPLPGNFEYDRDETVIQMVSRRIPDCLIHDGIRRAVRNWSETDWRCFVWHYYRYVEEVDRHIGIVLDALDPHLEAGNTVVLFASDHGESVGRHQMFQKFTLYEESVRVQLALFDPSVPSPRRDQITVTSGVDIFATVCDYAQVQAPAGTHGTSIRRWLFEEDVAGESFAYIESNWLGRAVVTAEHKYITEYRPDLDRPHFPPRARTHRRGKEQLFDLQVDPDETKNVARCHDKTEIIDELRGRLVAVESDLEDRALAHPRAIEIASDWSARVARYWTEVE